LLLFDSAILLAEFVFPLQESPLIRFEQIDEHPPAETIVA
jgi:hypothetical protein